MNETNETTMQTVYYWQDGYWITDQEEAELLDSINAFGSEHTMLEVPAGEDIQEAVNEQLIKRAA
ncbi:MAG: hypothetical protein R3F02_02190 [Thiolinea sp.]